MEDNAKLTTWRRVYVVGIFVLCIALLVPLFMMAQYARMQADDFSYGSMGATCWNTYHSVFMLFKNAFDLATYYWHNWQGTYASCFIMAFMPGIFGTQYYVLVGIMMLSFIIIGTCVFSVYMVRSVLGGTWVEGLAIGAVLVTIMTQFMPSAVQGLYWFDGAIHYVPFLFAILLLVCMLTQMSRNRKPVLFFVLSLLLVFFVEGGNFVTAFLNVFVVLGFLVGNAINKSKRNVIFCVVALVLAGACLAFSVLAPGNAVRQQFFQNPTPIGAITMAMRTGAKDFANWMDVGIVLTMACIYPVIYRVVSRFVENHEFSFPLPLLVLIGSIGVVCIMYCPPYYAMGHSGDLRLKNVIYFAWVVLIMLNVTYFTGWVLSSTSTETARALATDVAKRFFAKPYMPPIAVAGVLFCLTYLIGFDGLSFEAIHEMRYGEAQTYAREWDERDATLRAAAGTDVEVNTFSVYPSMLFFDEIWEWNEALCDYYGTTKVTLVDPSAEKTETTETTETSQTAETEASTAEPTDAAATESSTASAEATGDTTTTATEG